MNAFFLEILDFHDICDYGMVNFDFRRCFFLNLNKMRNEAHTTTPYFPVISFRSTRKIVLALVEFDWDYCLLIPFLGKIVRSSVESYSVQKPDFEKAKANIRVNKYEHDRLEQYTRRENVRIHNLPVVEGQTLTETVFETLNDMFNHGAEADPPFQVNEKDISVCHQVNCKQEKFGDDVETVTSRKQIIVRFVSRRVINNVYKL